MSGRPLKRQKIKEQAIPLINYHKETKQYVVSQEAREFLYGLGGTTLGVVSIAGRQRGGKSFLMDKLNQWSGFSIGHSVERCTTGLMLSTKTLESADRNTKLLFVDCEGTFSFEADQDHDSRVFALALLLSSVLMYNSQGNIDKSAMNYLQLMTKISEWIRVQSSEEKSDNLGDYFPEFIWLIRDFALQFSSAIVASSENGGGDAYLESVLANPDPIHDCIKSCFPHRKCMTFPRPVSDEESLQMLDKISDSDLRPEFVTQVDELRNYLIQKAPKKTAFGKPLTGASLCKLAELYCDCINRGAAPVIRDTWTLLSETHNQSALEAVLAEFQTEVKRSMDHQYDLTELTWILPMQMASLVDTNRQSAITQFKERCLGDKADILCAKLISQAYSISAPLVQQNETDIDEYFTRELAPQFAELLKTIPTFDSFLQEAKNACTDIERRLGLEHSPSHTVAFRTTIWARWMWSQVPLWTAHYFTRLEARVQEREQEVQNCKGQIEELKMQTETQVRELQELRQIKTQHHDQQFNIAQLKRQLEQVREECDRVKQDSQKNDEQALANLQLLQTQSVQTIEKLRLEKTNYEATCGKMMSEHAAKLENAIDENKAIQGRAKDLEIRNQTLGVTVDSLRNEVKEKREELGESKRETGELYRKLRELDMELAKVSHAQLAAVESGKQALAKVQEQSKQCAVSEQLLKQTQGELASFKSSEEKLRLELDYAKRANQVQEDELRDLRSKFATSEQRFRQFVQTHAFDSALKMFSAATTQNG